MAYNKGHSQRLISTGEMLYQDPKTKIEYAWDTEKNTWKQRGEDSNAAPQYDFDGKTYLHTGKQLKFLYIF